MGSGELGSGVGEASVGLGSGLLGVGDGLWVGVGEVVGLGDGDVLVGVLGAGVGGRDVATVGLGVFADDAPDRVVVPVTAPARDGAVLATADAVAVGEAVGAAGNGLSEAITSGAGAMKAAPPMPAGGAGRSEFVCTKPKMPRLTAAPAVPATASAPTTLRRRLG